ncbi:MAG: hypothetical protein GX231_01330 [Tissierellia bacterium]|jgi:hypothetical protein|nr:hypothetical protein [Tissierellia bacterium]
MIERLLSATESLGDDGKVPTIMYFLWWDFLFLSKNWRDKYEQGIISKTKY